MSSAQSTKYSPTYMCGILILSLACFAVIIFLLVHYVARGVAPFASHKQALYARPFNSQSDWD
jgi:hypothetical protein